MSNYKSIAVAGSILVDKINVISAYPQEGQLTQISKVSQAVGGCVPNVAIDIKKLSKDTSVYAVGLVGLDSEGEYATDVMSGVGVDVSFVKKSQENTSFTQVMSVNGGKRTFFTYAGASAKFGVDDVDFDNLNVDMLHLGYFLLLDKVDNGDGLKILQKAKQKGIKTSIDLVSENSNRYSLVLPCLKYVDNLIINEVEASALTGISVSKDNLSKIAQKLKELGVAERVIIHTPEQSLSLSNNGLTIVNSYDLPNGFIKGTTGAGDAFCAGALLMISKQKNDKEILEFASAVAVTALTSQDAVSGILPQDKTVDFCKNLSRKYFTNLKEFNITHKILRQDQIQPIIIDFLNNTGHFNHVIILFKK